MIFGADLSSYDGSDGSVVDAYQFVILNVKDPGIKAKVNRAKEKGIPWAIYTWVSPGGGANAIELAKRAELAYGRPPKGVWLDYEEAGVSPPDLTEALIAGERAGMDLGVYTYLAVIPSVSTALRGHPLWLAYYPGNNDGSYIASAAVDARKWGAKIWQYTSSNGTRDLNVILDEAWWATWGTGEDVVTEEQMNTLGAWMKQQRTLEEEKIGQWLKDVEGRLGKKIEANAGGGGGGGLSEAQVREIVRSELDKTKLQG